MHILIEEPESRKTFNDIKVVTIIEAGRVLWCIDKKCKVIQHMLHDHTVITVYANKPNKPTDITDE